jgi:hypothetical protein
MKQYFLLSKVNLSDREFDEIPELLEELEAELFEAETPIEVMSKVFGNSRIKDYLVLTEFEYNKFKEL